MIDLLDSNFWNAQFQSIFHWSMLIPIAVGIYSLRSHNTEQRKLFFYVVTSFVFEYFSQLKWAIRQFNPETNAPFYHFFTPVLFIFFVGIYQQFLKDFTSFRVDYFLAIFFILFSLWNAILGDGILNFPGLSLGLYAFLMMLIAVSFFLKLLTALTVERLEKEPMFWINSGVLIYFSGNFLLWLTMNYLLKDMNVSYSIFKISIILGLLLNILLSIAFVCRPKAVLLPPTRNQTPHGD